MHVLILGTRGVPARHGGFETFAQNLSLYLVSRNHKVTVYCQTKDQSTPCIDNWNGVTRVQIPARNNAYGTLAFDWLSTWHASHQDGVVLTLGYNTAVFSILYRLRNIPNLINMDGIEWKREKWSLPQRAWLYCNEWIGARVANHLIADHPEIARHLQRHTSSEKITVIPYGADAVLSADVAPLKQYGLTPKSYFLLVARPEPENSILEIVRAYSRKRREIPLVVLGRYVPDKVPYHKLVMETAGPDVRFLGGIYDSDTVKSLRFHARAYLHGHRVGGTNPSLIESLAAGNAVIAHDNRFNRWVAGPSTRFFQSTDDLVNIFDELKKNPAQLVAMEEGSRRQHSNYFTQEKVLPAYERLLLQFARTTK
jgi:glycosyltransferase involved in cell wall biosynthesis